MLLEIPRAQVKVKSALLDRCGGYEAGPHKHVEEAMRQDHTSILWRL